MPLKLHNKALLLATIVFASFFVYNYSTHKTAFYGDALGYYRYLPSVFIYNNLISQEALPKNKGINPNILLYTNPVKDTEDTSKIIIVQYTYGIAILGVPFFFIAHLYELARGGNPNGYSASYDLLI